MKRKPNLYFILLLSALVMILSAPLAVAQAPEGQEYIVQADDWLSKIAEKEYGDVLAYPSIVEATNAQAAEDDSFAVIDNPDLIEIGQKIWLPATLDGVVETAPVEEEVAADGPQFADFDPTNFSNSTTIDNEWSPLIPGTKSVLAGTTVNEEGETLAHHIDFVVTDLTKVIDGVPTVVAWIGDYTDDELVEEEIAFYAQDDDGNVWFFGEYPVEYENGEFLEAKPWIAGIEEAKAGIKMVAEPQLDTPSYFQGWGPAVGWSDFGQVDQMGLESCVPVDCYQDVLVMAESSLGEEGAFQLKYYARGVGNMQVGWRGEDALQEELELVELTELDPEALADVRDVALELEQSAFEHSPDVYGQTLPLEGP